MHDRQKYQPICSVNDVPHAGAIGITMQQGAVTRDLIVVNSESGVRVYINSCPHTGVALNWLPNQFFNPMDELLQCSMHGALFRPDDGYCVYGPCLGRSLEQLDCVVHAESVCLVSTVNENSDVVDE